MRIREAGVQDWPAVAALLRELGRPVSNDAETDPHLRSDFEQYLARPETVALLAEENGRTVGFVDMEFRCRGLPPLSERKPQSIPSER